MCYTVLKTGLISQANGSAYIETEKTKIACAVFVFLSTVVHSLLTCTVQLWASTVEEHDVS